MKIFAHAVFIFAVVLLTSYDAIAQGGADARRGGGGVALLRQLDLTPDQIQQIREMNREMAPRRTAARQRLREANRILDASIYSDILDEAQVAANLKEFQEAQAAVSALNFESELNIRKILNAEQLARFRDMRQRFNERREELQNRRRDPQQPGRRQQPR
jgi:Spy/CpxP family protein refolding chaperone